MAAGLYSLKPILMAHEQTGPVTRGYNVESADKSSDLISDYKPAPLPFYLTSFQIYPRLLWIIEDK